MMEKTEARRPELSSDQVCSEAAPIQSGTHARQLHSCRRHYPQSHCTELSPALVNIPASSVQGAQRPSHLTPAIIATHTHICSQTTTANNPNKKATTQDSTV